MVPIFIGYSLRVSERRLHSN